MRNDKILAVRLRKQGNSYNQINKKLGLPKSTLSTWLKDIKISDTAEKKISRRAHLKSTTALIKRNKLQTELADERASQIRKIACKETEKLLNNKLFIAAIALYWAEGYKKGAQGSKWKCVDFANSDPQMVKMMMLFFRTICKAKDSCIKAQLIAHKNVNIAKSINYWSKITEISKSNFFISSVAANKNSKGKRRNTLEHGTIHIRIYSVELFFKIIGWIDGVKKYFAL